MKLKVEFLMFLEEIESEMGENLIYDVMENGRKSFGIVFCKFQMFFMFEFSKSFIFQSSENRNSPICPQNICQKLANKTFLTILIVKIRKIFPTLYLFFLFKTSLKRFFFIFNRRNMKKIPPISSPALTHISNPITHIY